MLNVFRHSCTVHIKNKGIFIQRQFQIVNNTVSKNIHTSRITMSGVEYNWLGSTGLKVSNICLGTMTFGAHTGGRPSCTEAQSHEILDRFKELGGNFIDTADVYQCGSSEEIIGNWLQKQDREKFIIATKCCRDMDPSNPNAIGASRQNIMKSIDQSLTRLKTDYIDLYYIHLWDPAVPLEETLSALNDLVRCGKVRYTALSNFKGWQLQKAIEICKQRGYDKIAGVQNQYNLLVRSLEWEVEEVCRYEQIALLPWSPLKGGWLSGKLKRGDNAVAGTRIEWAGAQAGRSLHSHPDYKWFSDNDHAWATLDKCQAIADKHGRSVPQIAIKWLLQKQTVPSVIIGVRTLDQLNDNMKAATGWQLSPEEMSELDEVSAIPAPYPYDYIVVNNKGRFRPT